MWYLLLKCYILLENYHWWMLSKYLVVYLEDTSEILVEKQMSCRMAKCIKWSVCPAKTQISFGSCPVWSESLLCAQWVAKDPSFLNADSKDWSDWVNSRLIWVFVGRTHHFVGFVMLRIKLYTYVCQCDISHSERSVVAEQFQFINLIHFNISKLSDVHVCKEIEPA